MNTLGENNLTRYWYTCDKENGLRNTTHYPGNRVTDPANIPYWFYTHIGLNILWIITILLLLTPTGDSNNKGKILGFLISKKPYVLRLRRLVEKSLL